MAVDRRITSVTIHGTANVKSVLRLLDAYGLDALEHLDFGRDCTDARKRWDQPNPPGRQTAILECVGRWTFPRLRRLTLPRLDNLKLSSAGLGPLADCAQLRSLTLTASSVPRLTAAGLAALAQHLPRSLEELSLGCLHLYDAALRAAGSSSDDDDDDEDGDEDADDEPAEAAAAAAARRAAAAAAAVERESQQQLLAQLLGRRHLPPRLRRLRLEGPVYIAEMVVQVMYEPGLGSGVLGPGPIAATAAARGQQQPQQHGDAAAAAVAAAAGGPGGAGGGRWGMRHVLVSTPKELSSNCHKRMLLRLDALATALLAAADELQGQEPGAQAAVLLALEFRNLLVDVDLDDHRSRRRADRGLHSPSDVPPGALRRCLAPGGALPRLVARCGGRVSVARLLRGDGCMLNEDDGDGAAAAALVRLLGPPTELLALMHGQWSLRDSPTHSTAAAAAAAAAAATAPAGAAALAHSAAAGSAAAAASKEPQQGQQKGNNRQPAKRQRVARSPEQAKQPAAASQPQGPQEPQRLDLDTATPQQVLSEALSRLWASAQQQQPEAGTAARSSSKSSSKSSSSSSSSREARPCCVMLHSRCLPPPPNADGTVDELSSEAEDWLAAALQQCFPTPQPQPQPPQAQPPLRGPALKSKAAMGTAAAVAAAAAPCWRQRLDTDEVHVIAPAGGFLLLQCKSAAAAAALAALVQQQQQQRALAAPAGGGRAGRGRRGACGAVPAVAQPVAAAETQAVVLPPPPWASWSHMDMEDAVREAVFQVLMELWASSATLPSAGAASSCNCSGASRSRRGGAPATAPAAVNRINRRTPRALQRARARSGGLVLDTSDSDEDAMDAVAERHLEQAAIRWAEASSTAAAAGAAKSAPRAEEQQQQQQQQHTEAAGCEWDCSCGWRDPALLGRLERLLLLDCGVRRLWGSAELAPSSDSYWDSDSDSDSDSGSDSSGDWTSD
ncbi:hypothetical protein HYH02_000568 [Chlamydomonas schloesseri]|uniref:Uncharacterized protein n=1 Tax=Chlamydomonas schloesseri TaxID=2026947 RepID=A0A836BCT1_9CHLO|nr:hypothetical protein HYH02_000568 [Chlamydomonas schloesseri]|eukprot:KAG2454731.1 hypothetical protein HYH02_000568 [Chlamydomonas schloesseri]